MLQTKEQLKALRAKKAKITAEAEKQEVRGCKSPGRLVTITIFAANKSSWCLIRPLQATAGRKGVEKAMLPPAPR